MQSRYWAPLGALALICLVSFAGTLRADGKLLMVGGALSPGNSEVHEAFVELLGDTGPVVIVPAASGQPARAARRFTDQLKRHGVAASRIVVFPLALRDDSETENVDESQWSDNAWRTEHLATIRDAAGFWLTGGDQLRITKAMVGEEGKESPLLSLMRERLAAGAVIGGTSAGTAVMSKDMIAGGDSFVALTMKLAGTASTSEDDDSGRLFMDKGLGLIPDGIVDQHFDRRARLGRLVRALWATGQVKGYGIDEDTALLIDLASGRSRVLGRGGVTLLDAENAHFSQGKAELVRGIMLHFVSSGATFDLGTFEFLAGQGSPTLGKEYYGHEPLRGGGMALPNQRLDQALGYDLLDNHASTRLDRVSTDGQGRTLVYRFIQTDSSKGYWLRSDSGDRYNISGVRFDITTGL